MIGRTFNSWTVISEAHRNAQSNMLYKCQCLCGTVILKKKWEFTQFKSCYECYWKRKAIHNLSQDKVYAVWYKMRARCKKQGIPLCPQWQTLLGFFHDMGHKPENHSLCRRDKTKGFYKENCYWGNSPMKKRIKRKIREDYW